MKLFLTIIFSVLMSTCPNNQKEGIVSLYKGSLKGDGSEGFTRQNLVINSVRDWNDFLIKLDTTNTVFKAFENSIDFKNNTILIAIDSKKTTGGFSTTIVKTVQKGNKLQVMVDSKGPKPTDMVTMSLTQPIHIVKINKTNKEVIFVTQ